METQGTQNRQNSPWKENHNLKTELEKRLTLPDSNTHYRALVVKTVWHQQEGRHTDRWDRLESLETNPRLWPVTVDKGARINKERTVLQQVVLRGFPGGPVVGVPCQGPVKDPGSIPGWGTKIQQAEQRSQKGKKKKWCGEDWTPTLSEDMGVNFHDLKFSNGFLGLTLQHKQPNKRINSILMKFRHLVHQRTRPKKWKDRNGKR